MNMTQFLVQGFKEGFKIRYHGDRDVQMRAPNLKLECGTTTGLWSKFMKELKAQRYAGPF